MDIEVLRVFTDASGAHGNPLGVVHDSASIGHEQAQTIAAALGFSETIFIDDAECGSLRIHTPTTRLAFAGHPTVGAAWLLHVNGRGVQALHTDAGPVPVEATLSGATVTANPATCPEVNLLQLATPAQVDSSEPGTNPRADYLWSWLDEPAGRVRARFFARHLGIDEDEATGSAAVVLAAALGRELQILQGVGSRIAVAPTDGGLVRLSGRAVRDAELTAAAVARLSV
ncbi:PhzF family phenazine biosynthesis protein [Aestuariimicrobium ganziense]|uniref:PhzF family phenazine biosynthesis protein n=1 Tax=Aestuariimicrobium ganziense TaxID=2773677 RepID=UPI001941C0B6|nr:PhzF family phenazine biosynthesis protein [Aestuariimicrobium ganziense]